VSMITSKPLKYHGGKSYLANWIHSLAPPSVVDDQQHGYTHRNIVFAGGLGEFWNWLPVEGISEAVNDSNSGLTEFWQTLAHPDLFPELFRIFQATPFCEDEFKLAQRRFTNESVIIHAAKFFIRYRQSRQGLGKDYATPTTRTRRGMNENVSAWLSAVDGLPECHERLRRVEIRNLDFADFIEAYDHPRALFYCDPTYLPKTRTSTGEYGAHEMTEDDHIRLLQILNSMDGRCMLSGYHSALYDKLLGWHSWDCHEKEIDNKASSAKEKPKRTECVWTNY